jgi:hypothetical protein
MGFEQALSFAAPSAEEEQKRALLRTLKDLEYELTVGKISREDYDQVSAEIREKAKRVIAQTDETMKGRLEAASKRVALHAEQAAARRGQDETEQGETEQDETEQESEEPANEQAVQEDASQQSVAEPNKKTEQEEQA